MTKAGKTSFYVEYRNISRRLASLISEEPLLYSDDGSRTNVGLGGRGTVKVLRESKIESPTSAKRCNFYSEAKHEENIKRK